MKIRQLTANLEHEKFFNYLTEINVDIAQGLVKLNYDYKIGELKLIETFQLEDYIKNVNTVFSLFTNFFEEINWDYLFKHNYKFAERYFKLNNFKVSEDKSFCLKYIQYIKMQTVEIELLLKIYPELCQQFTVLDETEDHFYISCWKYLISYQQLSVSFLNKYFLLFCNKTFAPLIRARCKNFWKLNNMSIQKILSLC